MPSLIMPPVSPNASSQPVSGPAPRGRGAEQPDGSGFGAALDRSRASKAGKKSEDADTAVPLDRIARRKPLPDDDKKDAKAEPSDLLNMAFLTPMHVPVDPATAARGAAKGEDIAADALAAAADASKQKALPQDAAADALPQAEADFDPAKAVADAQDFVKKAAAQARKEAAPGDADAEGKLQAMLPQRAARAETPEQIASALPAPAAAIPGATAAGTASRAAARDVTPVKGATTAAQKTGEAAATDKAATEARPVASDKLPQAASDDNAPASQPTVFSLPQTAAASTERAAAPAAERTPQLSVAPPVGSEEWGPAIGQQMLRMSASGHHVAELNLNPAGLGPLKVTLSLGDNQAQAMFVSAHESVRKAVEAALPQLRTTLAEQGISLGQTSVGAEARQPFFGQGGGEFAQQNPRGQSGGSDYPGSSRFEAPAAIDTPATRTAVLRHSGSGVDTFA